MERLRTQRAEGLSGSVIRAFGLVFLLVGLVGRLIQQSSLMDFRELGMEERMAAMDADPQLISLMVIAAALQAIEACAVPIFAFLLVEGFSNTSNLKNYALRVGGVALACEIPYDLIMGGKLLWWDYQNPAFGVLLGLALLYFYQRFEENTGKNIAMKLILLLAAILWANILRLDAFGACVIVLTAALWQFRENKRILVGILACVASALISLYCLAAPMSFLILRAYNGEKGGENHWVNYLAYPVMLLAFGVISAYLL